MTVLLPVRLCAKAKTIVSFELGGFLFAILEGISKLLHSLSVYIIAMSYRIVSRAFIIVTIVICFAEKSCLVR